MAFKIDLTGKRYGKLTVLEYSHTDPKSRKSYWKCKCDCGSTKVICASNLRSGNTSSCGCGEDENREVLMKEFYNEHFRHGQSYTRIHRTWAHMKERCENPKSKDYALYGGRGISVCEEWSKPGGFDAFFKWAMDNGYNDELTIDRKDPNGNYEPSNCRWETPEKQANNRRTNRSITIDGETKTLAEWCKEYGKNYSAVYWRIESGMSPKEALTK